MRKSWAGILTCAVLLLGGVTAVSQPPEGKAKGPGRGEQPPPRGRPDGPPGGPPGGFEVGRLFPPFIREELNLSADQEKQLQSLEKEVRERVMKILTAEQKKKLETLRQRRPPGPPGGPPDGPGRPFDREGRPERPGQPPPPPDASAAREAIQWFATWESGLKEAQRSGRPILLVSAAPHCAGVSGIW